MRFNMPLVIIISKNNSQRDVIRAVRAVSRACRLWAKEAPAHADVTLSVMSRAGARVMFSGVSVRFLSTYLLRKDPFSAFVHALASLPNEGAGAARDVEGPVVLFESAGAPFPVSIGRSSATLVLDPVSLSAGEAGRRIVEFAARPAAHADAHADARRAEALQPATLQVGPSPEHSNWADVINEGVNGEVRGGDGDKLEGTRAEDKKRAFEMLGVMFQDTERVMASMLKRSQ
jgi:hypothetical protein